MNRLLLVDGDPRSLNVLGVSLTQAGYEVTSAADGSEALSKVEASEPDLLIAAVRLRKVDGFDLVGKLRERASLAMLPVILIGNDESVEERRRAHELAVNEFLTRPVFVRELVARVHLLFARRARHSLAEAQRHGESRLLGSTRDIAVVDLVQSLDAAGDSGVLHMSSGPHKARLYFRDGHVVDADLGTMRGEEAIYRAFLWYDAHFELELRPVTNPDVIVCSTQTIVRKGMQRVDAWLRSSEAASPQTSVSENPDVVTPTDSHPVTSSETPTVPAPPLVPAIEPPKNPTTSRPSAAPWTREIETNEVNEADDDAVAAGVPRRTPKMTGLVAVTVAVAAGVLLVAGMVSSPRWHFSLASSNGPDKQLTRTPAPVPAVSGALSGVNPSQSAQARETSTASAEPPALGAAPSSSPAESENAPADRGGTETPTEPPTVSSETAVSREGARAPLIRETPIDSVTIDSANLSALVRDAQRALLNGQTERARSLAQQAVSERPVDADAWLTLAAAQRAAGDLAAARETYLNCIQRAQTASLNHCRILASRQQAPEAHVPLPAETTSVAAVEATPPPTANTPPVSRLGIRAPEVAPSPSTSSDRPLHPPPASSSSGPAPPGSKSDSHG
jgi:CheY-like chemotaxis protein